MQARKYFIGLVYSLESKIKMVKPKGWSRGLSRAYRYYFLSRFGDSYFVWNN
jgi:hypothetical protein